MNNNQKKILLLVALVAGCALSAVLPELLGSEEKAATLLPRSAPLEIQKKEEQTNYYTKSGKGEKKAKPTIIVVYVNGAVRSPGLYELPPDARAGEAVTRAGGYAANADTDKVNIAKKLKDGSQVFVPYKKQSRR